MDTLEEALGGEFAQVAPNGVLGDAKFAAQILRDDCAGLAESFEDVSSALAGEHISTIAYRSRYCTKMHKVACFCANCYVSCSEVV